jgi:hypothetical protein
VTTGQTFCLQLVGISALGPPLRDARNEGLLWEVPCNLSGRTIGALQIGRREGQTSPSLPSVTQATLNAERD